MKTRLTILFAALILIVISTKTNAQNIYQVENISDANLKVYVTTDESQADLKVIEVGIGEAVKDGLWYKTATPGESKLKVFITTNETEANIKIYYVADKESAGWINADKRHYYQVGK